MKNSFKLCSILMTSVLLITACGGGGDSGPGPAPANVAPTANAGTDITVTSGTNITLSALASSDSDGTITSYSWSQSPGFDLNSQVTLSNANTATPSFTISVYTDTIFSFDLAVTDDQGEVGYDTVIITVTPDSLASTLDTPWTITDRTFSFDDVIYTGSKYIGVGYYGMAESVDGSSWSAINFDYNIQMGDVAANGNNIVAVPYGYQFNGIVMTTDGSNWQTVDTSSNADCSHFRSISHDGSQFIANYGNNICTSSDGSNWQLQSTQQVSFSKVVSGAGKYALLITGGLVTIDSLTSTAMNVPALPGTSTASLTDLIYGNSAFVGLRSGEIIYSADGATWSAISANDIPVSITSISYSSAKGFVAANSTNHDIYTSPDGATWSVIASSDLLTECGVCQIIVNGTNETLVVSNESFYNSSDLVTWSSFLPPGTGQAVVSSTFSVGGFFYGIAAGALVKSTDEINWTVVSDASVGHIYTALHDGTQFIAHTSAGGSSAPGIYYSADGISWTQSITFGSNYVYGASVSVGATTYNFVISGNAIEDRNKILFSNDGISYQIDGGLNAISPGIDTANVKQATTNGTIIVAISANAIYTNASGTWTTAATSTNFKDVVWTGTNFVAAGQSGVVMTSADGITWTTQTWLNVNTITDILVVGAIVYATDSGGKIATSVDHGVSWTLSKDFRVGTVITGNTIIELAYDGTTIYGFGSTGDTANVSTVSTLDGGTSWNVNTAQGTVVNGHVIYDATGSRFVTATKRESTTEVTGAITWAATTTQLPDDPSFAYVATQEALSGISLNRIHYVSGTPDSYTSGNAGYSEDGQNWVIKTGLTTYHFLDYSPTSGIFARLSFGQVETSTDGINYTPATVTGLASTNTNFNYMKYINDQYIGVNLHEQTGVPGIYTSGNGSDWTLISEADLGISQYLSDYDYRYTNIVDMEYDGAQYSLLFNHEDLTDNGYHKGVMLLTSTDLINFTLHETGIYMHAHELVLEASGYKIEGYSFVATHLYY
ncbi:MAG: PKD domain-containing protein [Gammaproteobacteria bacterium]|nr:PKD domain-containing protein [Gammaproteobacteria bacterium]